MTAMRQWLSVAVLVTLGAAVSCARRPRDVRVPTEKAKRGTFVVRVRERCELEAEDAKKIICPRFPRMWENMKITKLVPEGSEVKEGELLLSLDKTELNRQQQRLAADVRRAKAEVERLKKGLSIEREKLSAELERRKADLRIKELAVAYLEDLPTSVELVEAKTELRKAELDAAFAQEDFKPVKALRALGIQSEAEFNAARLAADEAEIGRQAMELVLDVTMAGADDLELTNAKLDFREAQLRRDLAKAELKLKVGQAERELEAAEYYLAREETDLTRFQESLKLADIHSPKAGVVVYKKTFQGTAMEKIKEGVGVRPYRHLLSIEDLSTMVADLQVEEAQIAMVTVGQNVKITLDAVKDEVFTGKVIEIGTITKEKGDRGGHRWFRGKTDKEETGIRVFDLKARLDGTDARLRSGMAGNAEIIVAEIPETISIPLDAVFKRQDGGRYVYVVQNGRTQERPVTTGRSAEGRVVVTDGLAEGEVVCLAEPEVSP